VSVNGNVVRDVDGPGIDLSGTVEQYLVTDNVLNAPVVDDTGGSGLVTDNLTRP
jgi:hypothetical protein